MIYMPHKTITWKRVKAGLYRGSNDTVIKREKGEWIVYRGRFDFTGRRTGACLPKVFATLREAKEAEGPIAPSPWLS